MLSLSTVKGYDFLYVGRFNQEMVCWAGLVWLRTNITVEKAARDFVDLTQHCPEVKLKLKSGEVKTLFERL